MNHKSLLIVAAFGLSIGDAAAQSYLAFGAGTQSCATWLDNPVNERLGAEYVAGLWTGLNITDRQGTHFVGSSTDARGKVGEVKKLCGERPSMSLTDAASTVWAEFRQQGR